MTMMTKPTTDSTLRFGKPSMTNLPYDLGMRIINTIMHTPKPDFTEADGEIAELEEKILKDRTSKNV